MVIAGWPCEDLSAAGNGKGLRGPRSGLCCDTLRIEGGLQQLPSYILETTPMQPDNSHGLMSGSLHSLPFVLLCGSRLHSMLLAAGRLLTGCAVSGPRLPAHVLSRLCVIGWRGSRSAMPVLCPGWWPGGTAGCTPPALALVPLQCSAW